MNRINIFLKYLAGSCPIIILIISLSSCRWTSNSNNEAYIQDSEISDQKGNPKDSSVFYLPMDMDQKFKDSDLNIGMDPFIKKMDVLNALFSPGTSAL